MSSSTSLWPSPGSTWNFNQPMPDAATYQKHWQILGNFLHHCEVTVGCIGSPERSFPKWPFCFYVFDVKKWKKCCQEFELAHPRALLLLSAPYCSGCGESKKELQSHAWQLCNKVPYVTHHWCAGCTHYRKGGCPQCSVIPKLSLDQLYKKGLAKFDPAAHTLTIGSDERVSTEIDLENLKVVLRTKGQFGLYADRLHVVTPDYKCTICLWWFRE